MGHYDAVILNEEPLSDAYGHNETISGRISQAFPIRDATGLCGDFLRLTTSGGNGQSNGIILLIVVVGAYLASCKMRHIRVK